VVFSSIATNLVSEDTNGFEDVFVRDRDAGRTRRVSLTFDGSEGDNRSFSAVISGDGQFVAFTSLAENLVANDTNGFFDIFIIPNPLRP
jgi:Tol biopolymer transport system component